MWRTRILKPFPLEQRLRRGLSVRWVGCVRWRGNLKLLFVAAVTGFFLRGERRVALCTEASADCGQALCTHRPRPPGFTAHPRRPGGPCAARQPNLASYIQS